MSQLRILAPEMAMYYMNKWLHPQMKLPDTSNIRRTLVCNEIVGHPDVGWASPVGAAPTTSSFST